MNLRHKARHLGGGAEEDVALQPHDGHHLCPKVPELLRLQQRAGHGAVVGPRHHHLDGAARRILHHEDAGRGAPEGSAAPLFLNGCGCAPAGAK